MVGILPKRCLFKNRIKPAFLRQATYGTLKLGFYHYLKSKMSSRPKSESFALNVGAAMASGASANALANPTDVLKVRMQSNKLSVYGSRDGGQNMLTLFASIYEKEGVNGLYRVTKTCVRIF